MWSQQNKLRSHLGGRLTQSHMNTLRFLKEFLKKGEISPRWGSLPNLASSLPYEQHLKLPQYFYLLMEKPLGCYFEVQSPYYQASVEKTIIENLASIEKISCSQNLRFFVIGCFDWKIGIFQQTVVRVYYILERNINEYSWINCVKFVCPNQGWLRTFAINWHMHASN